MSSKSTHVEDVFQNASEQATAVAATTQPITLDARPLPAALSQIYRVIQNLPAVREPTAQEQARFRKKVVYEKEKLLSIVAMPGESLDQREVRLVGREQDLEVAMMARWAAKLQDPEMLGREKQQRVEWDQERENEGSD